MSSISRFCRLRSVSGYRNCALNRLNSYVSCCGAADELQLSVSTIKRMCDQGILESIRTAGKHRRISRESVQAFKRSSGGPNRPNASELDSGQVHRMLRENPGRLIEHVKRRWIEGESIANVLESTVTPAMRLIGDLWSTGDLDVSEEHLCSSNLQHVLSAIRELIFNRIVRPPESPLAIGAMSPFESHSNISQMVQLVFEEQGWATRNLGGMVPTQSLLAAIRRWRPRVVWLTYSYVPHPERAIAENHRLFTEIGETKLLIGGGGVRDDLREQLQGHALGTTLDDIPGILRKLAV